MQVEELRLEWEGLQGPPALPWEGYAGPFPVELRLYDARGREVWREEFSAPPLTFDHAQSAGRFASFAWWYEGRCLGRWEWET
jgi:hypothetical protein